MNTERKTLISTACIGFADGFETLGKVWPRDLNLNKVEMIGWRTRVTKLLEEAKRSGYTVVHIHGRTRAMPHLPNMILIPTPELVNRHGKEYKIVVHAPNLQNERNRQALKASNPLFVWVENHFGGDKSARVAIDIVRDLKLENIRAGFMFDICHYIGAENLNNDHFLNRWQKALTFLETTMPLSIHLPMGQEKGDSLPFDDPHLLSDDMLKDLAAILNSGRIVSLVLEGKQPWGLRTVTMTAGEIEKQKARNLAIYDRLQKVGIV